MANHHHHPCHLSMVPFLRWEQVRWQDRVSCHKGDSGGAGTWDHMYGPPFWPSGASDLNRCNDKIASAVIKVIVVVLARGITCMVPLSDQVVPLIWALRSQRLNVTVIKDGHGEPLTLLLCQSRLLHVAHLCCPIWLHHLLVFLLCRLVVACGCAFQRIPRNPEKETGRKVL